MRGAKPKATVLKLITGNPGRRPLNAREAKPRPEIPAPPPMLSGDALTEWKRLTPLLAAVGLISQLDLAVLASYCQAWARWIDAERQLAATGLIIKAPNGYPMNSPYLAIANKAMEQLRQLAEQIGLSGSARSRIKAADPGGAEDPAERFLRGG
jgi:P27 family predicted phage terminase small subunit